MFSGVLRTKKFALHVTPLPFVQLVFRECGLIRDWKLFVVVAVEAARRALPFILVAL